MKLHYPYKLRRWEWLEYDPSSVITKGASFIVPFCFIVVSSVCENGLLVKGLLVEQKSFREGHLKGAIKRNETTNLTTTAQLQMEKNAGNNYRRFQIEFWSPEHYFLL